MSSSNWIPTTESLPRYGDKVDIETAQGVLLGFVFKRKTIHKTFTIQYFEKKMSGGFLSYSKKHVLSWKKSDIKPDVSNQHNNEAQ